VAGGGRPGDGSRSAAIVTFEGAAAETLKKFVLRVNGRYGNERSLSVQKPLPANSPPREPRSPGELLRHFLAP